MSVALKKKGPGLKKYLGNTLLRAQTRGRKVVVGILGDAGEHDGEIDTVALALIHEFGFGVPERSFLRRTFDTKKQAWFKLGQRLLALVVRQKLTVDEMLALLGERAKADVKRTIVNGIPPPLAASTIAQRVKGKATARLMGDLARAQKGVGVVAPSKLFGKVSRALKRGRARAQQMKIAAAVFGSDGGMGSFKPLIDTGRLLGSIDYEVR